MLSDRILFLSILLIFIFLLSLNLMTVLIIVIHYEDIRQKYDFVCLISDMKLLHHLHITFFALSYFTFTISPN